MRILYVFLILLLLSALPGISQDRMSSPEVLYDQTLGNQLLLYNGHSYQKMPEPYEGSPIFGDDLWNVGTVVYEDQVYTQVDLFYDTYKDKLVIEHHDLRGHPTYFYPNEGKVSYFMFNGNRFVTLSDSLRAANSIPSGYYQELFSGNITLYAKRKTGLYKEQKEGVYMPVFKVEDTYYLRANGEIKEVRSKASFKKTFPAFKKEINRFTRQNNLLFFPDHREASLIQLVRYCDTLRMGGSSL